LNGIISCTQGLLLYWNGPCITWCDSRWKDKKNWKSVTKRWKFSNL